MLGVAGIQRLTPNSRPRSPRAHLEPHNSAVRVATAHNAAVTSNCKLHREEKGRCCNAMYSYKSVALDPVDMGNGDAVGENGRGLALIVKNARQMTPDCCEIFRLVFKWYIGSLVH